MAITAPQAAAASFFASFFASLFDGSPMDGSSFCYGFEAVNDP
jgi:hypothetical protein